MNCISHSRYSRNYILSDHKLKILSFNYKFPLKLKNQNCERDSSKMLTIFNAYIFLLTNVLLTTIFESFFGEEYLNLHLTSSQRVNSAEFLVTARVSFFFHFCFTEVKNVHVKMRKCEREFLHEKIKLLNFP